MKLCQWLLLSCFWLLSFNTAQARNDVATSPPCTLEQHQKQGVTCQRCQTNSSSPDLCLRKWTHKGYKKVCQTGGTSSWTELWCHTPDKVDNDHENTASDAGSSDAGSRDSGYQYTDEIAICSACSIGNNNHWSPSVWLLLLLPGVVGIRRWSRRWKPSKVTK